MRKLILSGDDWFELKHTLDLFVIETNNAANEYEKMAAHVRVAELSERYANLEKRDREKTENCKRLLALVESAERLPEDEGGRRMITKLAERLGYEPEETTEERRERLREEAEARKAARRIVKGLCLWVSGAAMILAAMAGTAEMTYECVMTGFVALVALLYGLA